MNIILFEPEELSTPLPRTDPRAAHLLDVLRRREGDTFDAGVINGPRGKGALVAISTEHLALNFTWTSPPPPLPETTLIIGLPRPQTTRDVLRDATTLGATRLHFVVTERTDRNYASSTLWTSGEWRRHCLAGAAQAFDTRIPEVTWSHALADSARALPERTLRLALDNYEAAGSLRTTLAALAETTSVPLCLAFGPERGWGASDRDTLRKAGFTLAHLGPRVLRVETAVVAALAIARPA